MSKCIWYRGGSKKYVLYKPYKDKIPFNFNESSIYTNYCILHPVGNIIVQPGYEWDGASGPAIDTDDTMDGSLVHDVLYQLIREDKLSRKYRKAADKCIRKMCMDDGMPWWRATYWYFFLRIAGSSFTT